MHVTFGTDGVRGVANEAITPELALALGRASVRVLGASRVYVARDTRRSSPMLAAAALAGVCAQGARAVDLGVAPTPAAAHAARSDGCAGIVVSASHNRFADNGLKLFAPGGRKLSDSEQARVEAMLAELLDAPVAVSPAPVPTGASVGGIEEDPEALQVWVRSVLDAVEGRRLDGMKVVLDTANGANSVLGPDVLGRLGAEVVVLGASPDGTNINEGCGSTHPELLAATVVAEGAEVGIAFDGDADRLVAVDHRGEVIDGDQLLAICALDLRARGALRHDAVAVTVMSNLGFRQAMSAAGIDVVETPVGDRHVLEALDAGNLSLGGEQSGHLVFRDLSTTGDGLLSAVVVLDVVRRSGRSMAELADAAMTRLPQVLVNVAVSEPMPDVAERLASRIAEVQRELGDGGRILLRPSGTEPVVRVMAEATTEAAAAEVAARLAGAVEALR